MSLNQEYNIRVYNRKGKNWRLERRCEVEPTALGISGRKKKDILVDGNDNAFRKLFLNLRRYLMGDYEVCNVGCLCLPHETSSKCHKAH